jgi:RNA polymerase sigma factor (sigma-70 family)
MDKTIDECLKNQDILNIIKTVSGKFTYSIDQDELSSISMLTLWKCIQKYDNKRGAKFTSYLYQQLSYAFKNELKRRKDVIEYACGDISAYSPSASKTGADQNSKNSTSTERDRQDREQLRVDVKEMLDGLPEGTKSILEQRFFYRMTMAEIAKKNGYSRETARRRLKKAVDICKQLNIKSF